MNRILLFCALGALWGCRQAAELSGEAITLSCSTSESSKVGALTAGDEVAVFARLDGTETYFLEGAKYLVGSDGRSLTYGSTVYYPETKQAVHFYAYFPYHTGSFSVPSDQSTAAALKQADLCWANASTTPVSTPVSLTFQHLFARLIVQTNQPTTKIACLVVPSGTLSPATGQFTLNSTQSEVSTTGNELILPVQPLSRLIITVSGVEYVFEGSINLQPGQTTTLNLTLHPSTQTATLNGSSTTAWNASSQSGNITQAVSNVLTLHWANYVPQGATPDKITLTINNTDYTISSGITYANKTFTVPFASTALRYPYTISKITFHSGATQALPSCTQLLGPTIYKSASQTLGIKDPAPNVVFIDGLYWATGNLVAASLTAGTFGGCKIGAPGDGGLYFQFGSLIGYKGGNQANGGTGVGMPQSPLINGGTYWNGSGFTWGSDAMVWPSNLSGNPSSWPQGATTNQWYFGLQSGWSSSGQNIREYPGFASGGLSHAGVGDPCTYYLGGTWRLPTGAEYGKMCNNQTTINNNYTWAQVGGTPLFTSPPYGGNLQGTKLFFPASGYRYYSNGSFYSVTTYGIYWSSSVYDATYGLHLHFSSSLVYPQNGYYRSYGFSVRCVAEAL